MTRYHLDREWLEFEPIQVVWWKSGKVLAGIGVLAAVIIFVATDLLSNSPEELTLQSENRALREMLTHSQEQFAHFGEELDGLAEIDRELYRVILQAEDIPEDVWQVGTGGTDPYAEYDVFSLPTASLLRRSASMLDELERKLTFQDASSRDLIRQAYTRQEALAELPTIKPTPGRKVSKYGMRIHPISKVWKMHSGVDFTTPTGTPIYATGDGVVRLIANAPSGYGLYIVLEHKEAGFRTVYAHLSKIEPGLFEGKRVKRGEQIALSGNTGYSVGPHLHYEVRDLANNALNPLHFIVDILPEEYRQVVELANSDSLLASMD